MYYSHVFRDDKCIAVASLAWDPMVSVAAELMRAGIPIPASTIREDPEQLHLLVPK